MLRPKRLEWEDVDDFLIASNPLGGPNYFVSKSTTNAMIGRQYLGKGVSVYLAKELCQAHYDTAWLAGGEEVGDKCYYCGTSFGEWRKANDGEKTACEDCLVELITRKD